MRPLPLPPIGVPIAFIVGIAAGAYLWEWFGNWIAGF
jgi:hypothetical protein